VSTRDVLPDWTDDDEARLRANLERSGVDPDAAPSDELMRRVASVFVDAHRNAHRDRATKRSAPMTSTLSTGEVQNDRDHRGTAA
jgi:hypothetical protein